MLSISLATFSSASSDGMANFAVARGSEGKAPRRARPSWVSNSLRKTGAAIVSPSSVIVALADYGFDTLGLGRIVGSTASGNRRVTKLANWFGAQIVASREGPAWMTARGWKEVDWALNREDWAASARKRQQRG